MRPPAALLIACLAGATPSAGVLDGFRDPQDGKLDMSDWLLEQHGWLPVPIVITEPAVGYGLGLAAATFHRAEGTEPSSAGAPPSITAVGALYTESDTWGVGGGHFGSWKQDSIRCIGGIGCVDANLEFYVFDRPFGYNLRGGFLIQEVTFRIADSDLFAGPRYILFKSRVGFDDPPRIPSIAPEIDFGNGGLGIVGSFDSRDNILSPITGRQAELALTRYDTAFGGDYDSWQLDAALASFHRLSHEWSLGVRLDGSVTDGEAPFYALPFVQLRGVPALRYQGQQAASIEGEVRWEVIPRWSVVAFAGLGRSWKGDTVVGDDESAAAGGGGFRYLVARRLGPLSGLDIARGPEAWVVYIQMGQAWGAR
jgi:hypothetical protein